MPVRIIGPGIDGVLAKAETKLGPGSVGIGGAGAAFDPASLFASSEYGFWIDPSDFSTMFQGISEATPVTAVGQSVGRINDKSGNGLSFQQPTAGFRPILQQDGSGNYYLAFDGTDDWMFSAVDTNNFMGVLAGSDPGYLAVVGGLFATVGTDATLGYNNEAILGEGAGYWSIYGRSSNLAGLYHWSAGNNTVEKAYTVGDPFVFSARRSSGTNYAAINGGAESSSVVGALNAGAGQLELGRMLNTQYFNGRLYGAIVRAANTDAATALQAATWMASKTGVTI